MNDANNPIWSIMTALLILLFSILSYNQGKRVGYIEGYTKAYTDCEKST